MFYNKSLAKVFSPSEQSEGWTTVLTDDSTEVAEKLKSPDDVQNYPTFLIKDLLSAVYIQPNFISHDIKFNTIKLSGIVCEKEIKNNNYNIYVNDGSGYIKCLLNSKDLESNNNQKYKNVVDEIDKDYALLEGVKLMMSSIRYLEKSNPSWDDIKVGDEIKIMGNIREYANQRFIYVTKMFKQSLEDVFNSHLVEYCDNLYNK